jgi:hypothetical protein
MFLNPKERHYVELLCLAGALIVAVIGLLKLAKLGVMLGGIVALGALYVSVHYFSDNR